MPGGASGNECQTVEMEILSHPSNLSKVRTAVTSFATAVGFREAAVHNLVLAIDEALTNVIKHGYGGRADQSIEVRLEHVVESGRSGMRTTIRDYGMAVDPDSICGRNLEDVRPGGLGVHIIKAVMDEVTYVQAEGEGTRLTMLKWNQDE